MSTWNIGPFGQGSHGWIEPGSRYGLNPNAPAPGTSSSSTISPTGGFAMGGGPQHEMLLDVPGPMNGMSGGGIWNNNWIPSIAAGSQGQASGGFNTPYSNSNVPGGNNFSTGFPDFGSLFSANGTTPQNPFSLFGGSTSGIPGGSSMFPGLPSVNGKDLEKIYGKGIGTALTQFLNSGAGFNPAVIQAQQNAARPIEARGIENIMNAMGGHGLSGSSSAAIGVGDFETQFNAQLQSIFAQEYENSVSNYLNVLMGVKGDAKENKAQSNNWMNILTQFASAAIPIFS